MPQNGQAFIFRYFDIFCPLFGPGPLATNTPVSYLGLSILSCLDYAATHGDIQAPALIGGGFLSLRRLTCREYAPQLA